MKTDHRSGNLLILTGCVGRGMFVQTGVWEWGVYGWRGRGQGQGEGKGGEREGAVGMRGQC